MAGLYDGLEQVQDPAAVAAAPPKAPPAPGGLYEGLELVPETAQPLGAATPVGPQPQPRAASGLMEHIEAGFQGSAPGLAWRKRLPELVMNPETSKWWERAASGLTQVASELPLMVGGALVGAPVGGAIGGAVSGPAAPAGVVVGSILGAGAMMNALPAGIRESLVIAYGSGELNTAADWWNAVRQVALQTAKEGAIGAIATGGGAVAARLTGKTLAPTIGTAISVPTATRAIGTADVATQIAAMATMPAALQGRLPDAHEFLDAAIVIAGMKAAHVTAEQVARVFVKTGRTPAEQVADAQADPKVADEIATPPEPARTGDGRLEMPQIQEALFRETARLRELEEAAADKPMTLETLPQQLLMAAREHVDDSAFHPAAEAERQMLAEAFPGLRLEKNEDGTQYLVTADGQSIHALLVKEADRRRQAGQIDNAMSIYDNSHIAAWQGRQRGPDPAELQALKARIADLESRIQTREAPPATEPTFTADQVRDAGTRGEARLAELTEKAKDKPLTDQERAERVFLTAAKNNPEALARHFGIKPEGAPPAARLDASAQRVYDDVRTQLRQVDADRRASSISPLGDEHADAVAALVRARIRTRAERLGVDPWDLYQERPLQIRDATAKELAEAQKIPEGAPTFVPPETDLFGTPIEPQRTPRFGVEGLETKELPLDKLILSKEVPQFKAAAGDQGVIVPLGGKFDRTGVGPIQVWERSDGTLEVISGRHRLDLARRSGETTIPAQIHREAEGFTARQAATLDAQLNIREEQGSVADYAQYFKDAGITEAGAAELGLLARAKGRTGFAIARDASGDLLEAHRAGLVSDEAALAVSTAAPGSERLQALGLAMLNQGKSILIAVNTMKAVDVMAAERMAKGAQGDIFGFDDSAMREAAAMAKRATAIQRKIGEQIAAVSGASKRPELARRMGVDVQDPAGIQKKIVELRQEQYLWDNWPLYPELVAKLRSPDITGREGELQQSPVPPIYIEMDNGGPTLDHRGQVALLEPKRFMQVGGTIFYESVVADASGKPAGVVALGWRNGKVTELVNIHTFASRRREGLASSVLEAILQHNPPDAELLVRYIQKGEARTWWERRGTRIFESEGAEDGILTKADYERATAARRGESRPSAPGEARDGPADDPVAAGRKATEESQEARALEQVAPPLPEALQREGLAFPPETPGEKARADAEAAAQATRKLDDQVDAARRKKKADPNTLFQNPPGWDVADTEVPTWYYSELRRQIAALPAGKLPANGLTAEGWKKVLFEPESKRTVAIRDKNNRPTGETREVVSPERVLLPGVKPDEIKWSGLEEWLDLQEGRVTKAQVDAYLRGNGVRVTEVLAGGPTEHTAADPVIAPRVSRLQAQGYTLDEDPTGGRWGIVAPEDMGDIFADRADVRAAFGEIPPGITFEPSGSRDGWNIMQYGRAQHQVTGAASEADARAKAIAYYPELLEIPAEHRDLVRDLQAVLDYMNSQDNDGPSTKFGLPELVTAGAKEGTYRELRLILPEGEGQLPKGYRIEKMAPRGPHGEAIDALTGEIQDARYTLVTTDGSAVALARDAQTPADARTAALQYLKSTGKLAKRTFTESHWDEPGVLAHVRFNEREIQTYTKEQIADIGKRLVARIQPRTGESALGSGATVVGVREGLITPLEAAQYSHARGFTSNQPYTGATSRVLFVEEIQSDWAQKGKKRGFSKSAEIPQALPPGTTENGVPSAPFVAKTEAWVGLTLKRLIAYAAEHGYDKVAWTTGEQQSARYTSALRKQVDSIEWTKTEKGVQLVGYKGRSGAAVATDQRARVNDILTREDYLGFDNEMQARQAILDHNDWADRWTVPQEDVAVISAWRSAVIDGRAGRTKVVDTTEKEDVLSDAIGKAMSQKILGDPAQEGVIEGQSIMVSDTGLAEFYNRIVPNIANEVLRKLGGGRVGDLTLFDRGSKTPGIFRTRDEAMLWLEQNEDRINERTLIREEPRYNGFSIRGENGSVLKLEDASTPQPSFDVTPAMVEKAKSGLPLFQKNPAQDTRGTYQIAENLITTMQGADRSTVVHELGHSWLEEMRADAQRPGAPASLKADWETLRLELAIPESGDIPRSSHEQMARTIERYLAEGEAPSRELQSVFARFKDWLLEIYRTVTGFGVEINPELKGVLDRMLASDAEIAAARDLGVPRTYVAEAKVQEARKIVPGFKAEQLSMEPYADDLPPGPGKAPTDTHVNYKYINTPTDVKLAMQRMAEIDQENIQAQRGGTDGVKSWEQSNAEQAKYLNDVLGGGEDTLRILAPRKPNESGPDVKLGILKKLTVGAAEDAARLRDVILAKGHDATILEQLEYLGAIERARMIQAEFLGERAGVARALNALKDATEGSGEIARMLEVIGVGELRQAGRPRTPAEEQAYLKKQLDEILLRYKGRSVLDIALLHKEIGSLKGSYEFVRAMERATTWEMLVEGWKSGLLSGPVTHTTNLFGTGAYQAFRAPVDALAALVGAARGASVGMGEGDRASMSESVARLTGWLGGTLDGIKAGYHAFQVQDPSGKTESYRNAIPGRAGDIIRIPLRLMGAGDAMTSTMYERGEIHTLAIRQAFDENLNPGSREFAERVAQLRDKPTPEMEAIAEDAKTRMTFNAPLGEKGVALQLFVNKWNLQWMIPFIRTPINITKEVGRMSVFAPLVGEWRTAMRAGGVERDRAIAEMAIGTGLMAVTMAYAFSGQVTGGGSPDPGKNRGKAGVSQPYSWQIGDTWYEYARIQPMGTLMGIAADLANVWDHATDEEKDKVPRMLALAFSNAVTNQTFLQGITNAVNAMSDPRRFGPRFFQQFAGSMVPNIIGQPTAMADPVVREVNGAVDAIKARVPGFRQELLPKRDWLGEEVKTKERLGGVLPVREQKISEDKVRLEAARLDISMAAAPKKTHIGKGTGKLGDVELTPEERDVFEKVGGEMAHRILANIVQAPGYDTIPDLVKRRIFSMVLTASHQVAAAAALPPEKRIAYLQSITEKMTAELAPAPEQGPQ